MAKCILQIPATSVERKRRMVQYVTKKKRYKSDIMDAIIFL